MTNPRCAEFWVWWAAIGSTVCVTISDRVDAVVLHPVAGPLILAVILFLVFQAVCSPGRKCRWTRSNSAVAGLRRLGWERVLPASLLKGFAHRRLYSPGWAACLVCFCPQIIILFFFILMLEDSGYLPPRRVFCSTG